MRLDYVSYGIFYLPFEFLPAPFSAYYISFFYFESFLRTLRIFGGS